MSIEREVALAARDMRTAAQNFKALAQDSKYASDYINKVRYDSGGNNPSYRGRLERIRSQRNIDSFLKTLSDSDELHELDKASAIDSRVRTSKEFETYKELQSRRLKLSNPSAYRTSILQEKYGAFAVDAEQIERAEQSAEANSYIDSLLNHKKYRDDQGRKKWGSNWDRVKLAEDKANTRAIIMNTLGLNKLTALMKSPFGVAGAGAAVGIGAAYYGWKTYDNLTKKSINAQQELYADETMIPMTFTKANKEYFDKNVDIARQHGMSGKSFASLVGMWNKMNSLAAVGGDKELHQKLATLGITIDPRDSFETFKSKVAQKLSDPNSEIYGRTITTLGLDAGGIGFLTRDNEGGTGRKASKDFNKDERRQNAVGFQKWKENLINEEYEKSWIKGALKDLQFMMLPEGAEFKEYNALMDESKGFEGNHSAWLTVPSKIKGFFSNFGKFGSAASMALNPAGAAVNLGGIVVNISGGNKENIVSEAVSKVKDELTNALSGMFGD